MHASHTRFPLGISVKEVLNSIRKSAIPNHEGFHKNNTNNHRKSTFPKVQLIDVRPPREFLNERIELLLEPNVIMNLPVLDNEEHETIGKMHVEGSKVSARILGASLITKNISKHLHDHILPVAESMQDQANEYLPIIMCWRGGQRSQSFAEVLSRIGFRSCYVEGGIKEYRRLVVSELENFSKQFKFVAISGRTGSGKTRFLRELEKTKQVQVIDFEKLAEHCGSVLGNQLDLKNHGSFRVQPSQKNFESRLFEQLSTLDPNKPVYCEAEMARIGNLIIPVHLWHAACVQPHQSIVITSSLSGRIELLLQEYHEHLAHPEMIKSQLRTLSKICGHKKIEEWCALIDQLKFAELVHSLLIHHYDPCYDKNQVLARSVLSNKSKHIAFINPIQEIPLVVQNQVNYLEANMMMPIKQQDQEEKNAMLHLVSP